MKLRLCIDELKCVGSGECAESYPAVFTLSERSVATITGDPGQLGMSEIHSVVLACPSGAISLVEEEEQ